MKRRNNNGYKGMSALILAAYLTLVGTCYYLKFNKDSSTTLCNTIEEVTDITKPSSSLIPEEDLMTQQPIQTIEPTKNNEVSTSFLPSPAPTPEPTPTVYEYNDYAYLNVDSEIYAESNENSIINYIEQFQKVFRISGNGEYDLIMTEDGIYGFIPSNRLTVLNKNLYVEVDIDTQTLRVFKNYEEVFNTLVTTGKDSTPTILGYFDIDYKSEYETLTGYKTDGSIDYQSPVYFWMPFEGGYGMHQLSQDNYGGDIYHNSGSHGCVRMSYDAAEQVYNLVNIGDMILVKK